MLLHKLQPTPSVRTREGRPYKTTAAARVESPECCCPSPARKHLVLAELDVNKLLVENSRGAEVGGGVAHQGQLRGRAQWARLDLVLRQHPHVLST